VDDRGYYLSLDVLPYVAVKMMVGERRPLPSPGFIKAEASILHRIRST